MSEKRGFYSEEARQSISVKALIRWSDPAFKESVTARIREVKRSLEVKRHQSESSKRAWADSGYIAKREAINAVLYAESGVKSAEAQRLALETERHQEMLELI